MFFARVCCLSLATVSLSVGMASAQVPPAPYVPPAPILNPSSSLVVPQPPPVPVSPGAPLGSLGGYGSNVFGTGEYLRGTNEVVNPPQCAAPFPSTPARSALNQTRRHLSSVQSARCLVLRGMALNAAEHIRITLDHGFGDGLHVLVIATCLSGMEVRWCAHHLRRKPKVVTTRG